MVVRFSGARRRYERHGILVEEASLEHAEEELADEETGARRRQRDAERRGRQDLELEERMAEEIMRMFPRCPRGRARTIAHASLRGSGRVGRSAAGRALDAHAIELAVIAAVRHEETPYDELLMAGLDWALARSRVEAEIERVLAAWRCE